MNSTLRLFPLLLACPVSVLYGQPGRLGVVTQTPDAALKDHPAMISAIRNGSIVRQYEIVVWPGAQVSKMLDDLAEGTYDVRIEGDGMVTEEKHGVHVFAGKDGALMFVMHSGKGAHMVEYATGGLSREEVAARLAKLESAVAQLQKAGK
jgi:hypothetical protein